MRVLLRSETGLFLGSVEEWTTSAGSALAFKSCFQAIEFAREKGLRNAEVVLSFDDPAYDLALPLQPRQGKLGK